MKGFLFAWVILFSTPILEGTPADLELEETSTIASLWFSRGVHRLKPGESILIGSEKVLCEDDGDGIVTRCTARNAQFGFCCTKSCITPRVAHCKDSEFFDCMGAKCQCVLE